MSPYSNISSATTALDTTPPTAPTGLTATAASSSQIDLSWFASTDNVGVTGYLIERCQGAGCTSFAQIVTATTTSYNDSALAPATSYSYRVRATDAAGNLSTYSGIASATTKAGGGPIAFVQKNFATPHAASTSVPVVYSSAQNAGDLNVVIVGWYRAPGVSVSSVTDSKGNGYALAVGPTVNPSVATESIYYARNIAPAAAGANTVTVKFSGSVPEADIRILEYSGIDTINPLDVAAAAIGTGTATSSGSVTTTNANDLLVGANMVAYNFKAAGPGYTARIISTPNGDLAEDQVVTTIGSYSASATQTVSGGWLMQLAAFRMAGGGGGTAPPSAPTGLTATAASSSQINLSWTASTGPAGVTGYLIERCQGAGCTNFVQLATSTTTTFSDSALAPSTSYSYRLRATDGSGDLSAYSSGATATTSKAVDTTPPTAPSTLTATVASSTQINLSWIASTDDVGVTGYFVERCQGASCTAFAQIGTTTGTTISFSDSPLAPLTSYSYRVRATDAAGNLSAYSNVSSATTPADTTAPTAPTGLNATAVSSSQINLSWTASTDNVGVTGYLIERCQGASCANFAQISTSTTTTYSDTGLTAATSYSYRVRATDAAGNLSTYSGTATASTGNVATPPTAPTGLTATAASSTQINLGWTASTDNVGVTGYLIERCQGAGCSNFVQIGTTTGTTTTFSDSALAPATSYSYRVRATDAAGYLSAYSGIASASTMAGGGPIAFVQKNFATPHAASTSVPVVYSSAQNAGDLNVVIVGWYRAPGVSVSSVTDSKGNGYALAVGPTVNPSVATESIYYARNIAPAAAGANTVTVKFSGSVPEADIRILEYSGIDTINPLDVAAAAIGTGTATSSGSVTTTNANDLLVGANMVAYNFKAAGPGYTARIISTPNGDLAEDQVVTTIGSYSASATQTVSGGWLMQLAAFRMAGGGGDPAPPSAPTGLTATAASGSQINLSWTAATGGQGGVSEYLVERCSGANCTNFAVIGSSTTTTYNDTGLTASTSYSYRLRAMDGNGDLSVYSGTASASTSSGGDTTPPTAPASLTATAASSTQINLGWTASMDNVGVTGYLIERCQGANCTGFAQIGTSTTTTYNDTGLTAATSYSYRARATDAAGNLQLLLQHRNREHQQWFGHPDHDHAAPCGRDAAADAAVHDQRPGWHDAELECRRRGRRKQQRRHHQQRRTLYPADAAPARTR